MVIITYIVYKIHDFTEPFAYGHARWSDATFYWFGMMHLDLGYTVTKFMNVEGIMDTGELIFYKSIGPLEGVFHSFFLSIFNGSPWAVRVIPLFCTLLNFFLLANIANRFFGSKCYLYLVILYFSCPFIIKYGSSDVGFFSIAISLGLTGWICYLEYFLNKNSSYIYLSIMLFSIGILFNWHSAFMGLPIYFHILFGQQLIVEKIKVLTIFSLAIIVGFFSVIIHQGFVSNDFFYPLIRVMERSKSVDGAGLSISWWDLIVRQAMRAWQYFGQIVCILVAYWLVKLVIFRGYKKIENQWVIGFIFSGIFLGFLIKNAAYNHDYLMLGFLPGVILAAVSGGLQLTEDLSKVSKKISYFIISLLLIAHLALGMKSAKYFEGQEQQDLLNGEASVALFLEKRLTKKSILAGDFSSGYHKIADSKGVFFENLKPHLSYLTRRPVRFVESTEMLNKMRRELEGQKEIVFIQLSSGPDAGNIKVPKNWAYEIYPFDSGTVFFLKNK